MKYEVENKFPVADLRAFERLCATLGAQFGAAIEQVDHYFAHPQRDFAATDEALRLRRTGEQNLVTYKGPKTDRATKTRQELEIPLADGAQHVAQYVQLFNALGFRSVAEVRKRRRYGQFAWRQFQVEATLDEVDELGSFVELEILVDADVLPQAQAELVALAAHLGLPAAERRSYLEMFQEHRSKSHPS